MTQFFVLAKDIIMDKAIIRGEEAKHLIRVLRKKLGDHLRLFDGSGQIYNGEIEKINERIVQAKILSRLVVDERKTKIHLYQSLLKSLRMDSCVEKVTQLGIEEITPVISERTVVCLNPEKVKEKIFHWQKIALQAAKQSDCVKLPTINFPIDLIQAFKRLKNTDLNFIFWEKEKKSNLKEVFSTLNSKPETINLFIGPEGGFSDKEISLAKTYGLVPVGLKGYILRSETAAIVAASIVLYERKEL